MKALDANERPARSIEEAFKMHDHYSRIKYFSVDVLEHVTQSDLIYRGLGDDTYTEPCGQTGVLKNRRKSNK